MIAIKDLALQLGPFSFSYGGKHRTTRLDT